MIFIYFFLKVPNSREIPIWQHVACFERSENRSNPFFLMRKRFNPKLTHSWIKSTFETQLSSKLNKKCHDHATNFRTSNLRTHPYDRKSVNRGPQHIHERWNATKRTSFPWFLMRIFEFEANHVPQKLALILNVIVSHPRILAYIEDYHPIE